MKTIQATYELNPSNIGPPTCYLGADVEKVTRSSDPTGREYWSFSAHTYVVNAVKNVKTLLQEEGWGLKKSTPFPSTTYHPEVDLMDECCDNPHASHYQNLVLVQRWAVELGCIDIYTMVALLLHHVALPQMGHLEALYHVLVDLHKHDKSRIIFDPTNPVPVTPSHH